MKKKEELKKLDETLEYLRTNIDKIKKEIEFLESEEKKLKKKRLELNPLTSN